MSVVEMEDDHRTIEVKMDCIKSILSQFLFVFNCVCFCLFNFIVSIQVQRYFRNKRREVENICN